MRHAVLHPLTAYVNRKSRSSGYFFYRQLAQSLNSSSADGRSILCNIDCNIWVLAWFKLMGKRVLVRCDGIYLDKPTGLVSRMVGYQALVLYWIYCALFRKSSTISGLVLNGREFLKLLIADCIVYQSSFSQEVVFEFFPYIARKRFGIINNASTVSFKAPRRTIDDKDRVACVGIFDVKRARKRTDLLILCFDRVVKRGLGNRVSLKLVGHSEDSDIPSWFDLRAGKILKNTPRWLDLRGPYGSPSGDLPKELIDDDFAVTLSQYDPCPNYLIECINAGLPVIAVDSGGIAEIVGDAGILIPDKSYQESGHRDDLRRSDCEWGEEIIEYMAEKIAEAIQRGVREYPILQEHVKRQAMGHLGLGRAVSEYQQLL